MKLSFKSKSTESKTKKKMLFVCVENAGRSQMAEGFFRKYGTEDYEPISAGTRHKSQINPVAVEVMKEVGIDISGQKPKGDYRRHDAKRNKNNQHGLHG